ncbi:MAG: ABC transporter permease [Candidatus Glassbacteria bacterium]|nr:ABC transporter permease [Candidatus Glassbacteria bacterium]
MRSKIASLALKEYRHIMRDKRSLATVFVLPIAMILLYGYAINLDVKDLELAVVDRARSPESRLLVEKMEASGYFTAAAHPPTLADAEMLVYSRRVRGILVIPEGFSRDLRSRADRAAVQLLLDGSDSNTAGIAGNYFEMILAEVGAQMGRSTEHGAPAAPFEVRPRVIYNPELKSVYFIVPGLAAVLLMLVCAVMTSMTIAREKETGTLEQILTSPIKPYQILIGKVLPYLVIAFLVCAIIVAFAHLWFGVPVRGSLLLLAAVTPAYLFCALSLGIAISASVRTQQVAVSLAMLTTMLPSVMLSGFIFRVGSMPLPLRLISKVIPATYYLKIIRGIMLKGVGWEHVWQHCAVLVGMGLLILLIGARKFSTRLD